MKRTTATLIAAVAAVMLAIPAAEPVQAQGRPRVRERDLDRDLRPVAGWAGVNFIVGVPVGEFKDYISAGYGLNANGEFPLTHESPLSLRADLGFLIYGSETKRVCFSETVGCRVELDVRTTNSIYYGNIGPQLMLPRGPVRPYVNAGVGFSYFVTSSGVNGSSGNTDFAHTNNFHVGTLAYAAGGGLLVRLGGGKVPVMLDLGARYNSNGSVEYLKKGDIHDNPDGSISFTPTRSDANLVTLNLGVSLGIRPESRR